MAPSGGRQREPFAQKGQRKQHEETETVGAERTEEEQASLVKQMQYFHAGIY